MSSINSSHFNKGFSLIEVLVALLILTLGIAGTLKLQTQSLKSNQRAYFRTQADLLIKDVFARMQANKNEARKGAYISSSKPTSSPDCLSQTCDPSQLAKWDLYQWYENVENNLPNGSGELKIFGGDNNTYLISIRWDDRRQSENIDKENCGKEAGKVLCWGTIVQL